MFYNAIRENKILAKISGFKVTVLAHLQVHTYQCLSRALISLVFKCQPSLSRTLVSVVFKCQLSAQQAVSKLVHVVNSVFLESNLIGKHFPSQQAHNLKTALYQHQCDVDVESTLFRRHVPARLGPSLTRLHTSVYTTLWQNVYCVR